MPYEAEPIELKLKNLKTLHDRERFYGANPATQRKNSRKTFVPIVAPYASGKTVVSEETVKLDPRIQLINTTTTRLGKDEDPPGFKAGFTSSWFVEHARQGMLSNFSVIPGVDAYGTLPEDFPGQYNIGPFLPSSLNQIKKAGFEHLHAVYLVTPQDLWREFVLESRQGLGQQTFVKRALESIDSADYAIEHLDDFIFLENNIKGEEGITKLAQKICDITINHKVDIGLPKEQAIEYLNGIKSVAHELALH